MNESLRAPMPPTGGSSTVPPFAPGVPVNERLTALLQVQADVALGLLHESACSVAGAQLQEDARRFLSYLLALRPGEPGQRKV